MTLAVTNSNLCTLVDEMLSETRKHVTACKWWIVVHGLACGLCVSSGVVNGLKFPFWGAFMVCLGIANGYLTYVKTQEVKQLRQQLIELCQLRWLAEYVQMRRRWESEYRDMAREMRRLVRLVMKTSDDDQIKGHDAHEQ
jgi:hypothetical protein